MLVHSKKILSDTALIQSFCSGSEAAFNDLFNGHRRFVASVCLKYLRDSESSRDACMEIFGKLWEGICGYSIREFRPWLYVYARNHCLMQLRKEKTKNISLQDVEFSLSEHPFEENDLAMMLSRLENLLPTLSHEQQTCVRLFFLEEKSYAQIAVVTGWEIHLVKSYLQNGKRNLLRNLRRLE